MSMQLSFESYAPDKPTLEDVAKSLSEVGNFILPLFISLTPVPVTRLVGLNVPIPDQRTEVTVRLNNGQHYVDSLPCRLQQTMQTNAEFEL